MPQISARVTEWTAYSINVRTKEGCPFFNPSGRHDTEQRECMHPRKALAKAMPCALHVDRLDCPLERHPVLVHRVPDYIDDAAEKAAWEHTKQQ